MMHATRYKEKFGYKSFSFDPSKVTKLIAFCFTFKLQCWNSMSCDT